MNISTLPTFLDGPEPVLGGGGSNWITGKNRGAKEANITRNKKYVNVTLLI